MLLVMNALETSEIRSKKPAQNKRRLSRSMTSDQFIFEFCANMSDISESMNRCKNEARNVGNSLEKTLEIMRDGKNISSNSKSV